ncbi:hypothetical protein [Romboutsia sp. 1001285H_161024_C4]|uniref:hypothetical protein n=1 Tax=Romboutsia sp. 1001285H_161024_C4 TaxID=2787109 RepID=UPI001898AD55|nr:hypothetical protein [Romboutsia sp. 1001285H_161024_C4]
MKFNEFTKVEFLEEYSHDSCPNEVGLPILPICKEGDLSEECKKCWELATQKVEFKNPIEVFREKNISVLDDLRIVEEQYNMLKEGREKLKEDILKQMELYGIEKFENDNMSITYVKGSTGTKFDSTKFKKEQPELFGAYQVPAIRAASIRFKVK